MSAIAEAIKLYGPDFPRVHGLYLEHGYCYSEPAVLALARPCIQSDYKRWVGPEEADAWWVELVVGPLGLATLYSHIPFPLPKNWLGTGVQRKANATFLQLQQTKDSH
jgi:hypothetical protein